MSFADLSVRASQNCSRQTRRVARLFGPAARAAAGLAAAGVGPPLLRAVPVRLPMPFLRNVARADLGD